ncbi:MAG: NAD-dependent epimerase/dehydratase family protein [Sphingomonadaceae bacterium]
MAANGTLAITGATGFVGQAVLDEAARQGLAVSALTRRPQAEREGISWVEGTLDDAHALRHLAEGSTAMLHIAALTNAAHPTQFEAANVAGTAAVIEACKHAGLERLVFVSSLSAREPDLSDYGASKARAEVLVRDSGLDWTIVRPPAVYGPRDKDMLDLFRAARLRVVPLPPKGRTSLIHVADLADALLALVPTGTDVSDKLFEVDDGQPQGYLHREMARLLGIAVGRRRVLPLNLPARLLHTAARGDRLVRGMKAKLTPDRARYMVHSDWVCDPAFAAPADRWQPRIGARTGFTETARWYRAHGWLK